MPNARLPIAARPTVVLLTLLLLTTTGFSCGLNGTVSPPPKNVIQVTEANDPIQNQSGGQCGSVSSDDITSPTQWFVTYDDHTNSTVSFTWPTNLVYGQIATLGYYYAANTPSATVSAVNSAIAAWNTALTANKNKPNGYVQIRLVNTSDPYAPIKVYPDYSRDIQLDPSRDGGLGVEEFGSIDPPYTNLSSALIVISSQASSRAYNVALHEVGHSLRSFQFAGK